MDENHDNEAQSGIPTDPTPVVPRADVTWELPMEAEQGAVPIAGPPAYWPAPPVSPPPPATPFGQPSYPQSPSAASQPAYGPAAAPGQPAYGPAAGLGQPIYGPAPTTPPAGQPAILPHDHHGYAGYGPRPSWAPAPGAAAGANPPPPPPPWSGRTQAGPVPPPPPEWGGYGYPPAGGATPPGGPTASRGSRGKAMRAAAALFVVVATTAAGVGIGHEVWQKTSASQSALGNSPAGSTSPSTTTPNNGSNGNSGSGNFPFGNGFPFGGTGSTGSGNTGSNHTGAGSPANVSSIASSVSPDLVDINTTLGDQGGSAAGTGIVLTSNGEVLTNNHVIDGATSISVTDIGNGQTYRATVVGYNRTSDIAVIQLQGASGLKTATLGDSSSVSVGQGVVAIGNAGGVGGTPSYAGGSVTALDQTITASDQGGANAEQLSNMIEINANIEPGDSGGSLVDSSGKVIGIDTAASTTQFASSTTQGYAIPINRAITIANEIVNGQASSTVHIGETAFLGVGVVAPSAGTTGAAVTQVLPGSAAAAAGLVAGDTITALGGQTISSPDGLTNAIEPHHPGDQVSITWVTSSGQQETGTVTFANGPAA